MANLVPLHLDKQTGRIIATFDAVNSLPTALTPGLKYCQAIAGSTWTITHNQDTENFIYQIYDTDKQQVFPEMVEIVSPDVIEIRFNAPQAGCAHIVFFAAI